jgi:hypothetical protein
MRDRLRREFLVMYRCAEDAYAALDFSGKGFVDEKSFFDNMVVSKRVPYSQA